MALQTNDPIGCVPATASVMKALEDARRRVSTLEFLLEVSRGVETRMSGTPGQGQPGTVETAMRTP
jgi:hypothetical protein